jgi:hypothetical protein
VLDELLPRDLKAVTVLFDCSELRSASPSSVDELVKIVFSERGTEHASFSSMPPRTLELLLKSSQEYGFSDRLEVEHGANPSG